jgi:hypothetical protein
MWHIKFRCHITFRWHHGVRDRMWRRSWNTAQSAGAPLQPAPAARGAAARAHGGSPERQAPQARERAARGGRRVLPPLLRALTGDPLRAVANLLPDAALTCFRLVCRAFRDHSSPALKKCGGDFLRTRALVAFAWAASSPPCRACSPSPRPSAAWASSWSWSTSGSARSQQARARLLRRAGAWTRWPGSTPAAVSGPCRL